MANKASLAEMSTTQTADLCEKTEGTNVDGSRAQSTTAASAMAAAPLTEKAKQSTTATATSSSSPSPPPSSLRRLACDACRARKVRCDRQDPPCNRCAKLGVTCRYSNRSKSTMSKMDLSRFLVVMNKRLEQAEAQLASTHLMQQNQQQQLPLPWADLDMRQFTPTSPPNTNSSSEATPSHLGPAPVFTHDAHTFGMLSEKAHAQQSVTEWCNQTTMPEGPSFSSFDVFSTPLSAEVMMAQTTTDIQPFELEPGFLDPSSSTATSSSHTGPIVSTAILQALCDRYFEVTHHIMPIVDRARFQREMLKPLPSVEVQLLSYSMAALAALSSPDLRHHVDQLYEQARDHLDACERQESGDSLSNINLMQACVLLTFYELKQPNFARAWLTLGRAIRLARMTGLDNIDGNVNMAAQWGLRSDSSFCIDLAAQEERRRTFWCLYIFDSFTCLKTNCAPVFDKVAHLPLPSPSDYPDYTNIKMPALQQVFELPEAASISPFAATTVMIYLYQRYFIHTQSSYNDASHPFWETHYAIDKAIMHCRTSLLAHHVNDINSEDPMVIGLRMNLNAIQMSLHETALSKVEKDQLPRNLATEAMSKCASSLADVVQAVQLGLQLTGTRLETWRQLDRFIAWPITTSIQFCCRNVYNEDGENENAAGYMKSLRILSDAMRELVDPEHVTPGLMENADGQHSESGRPITHQNDMDGFNPGWS